MKRKKEEDRYMFKPKLIDKRWIPSMEEKLLDLWTSEDLYKTDYATAEKVYVIDTPPPYISNKWHVAGAAHYTQIDMMARYKRMCGEVVYFPFGTDRNGLPVEVIVERKYNVKGREMPREEFLKLCKAFLDEVEAEVLKQAKRLGLSADFKNYYQTDSSVYRSLTQATFIELWKRGLVYKSSRPSIWCWECGTSLAEAEIEYEERETKLVYIKFKVVDEDCYVSIATTRPELLCACDAVIFNPTDERYKDLEGRFLEVPLYGKKVKVLSHTYAKPDFGTGLVMICSYGDISDVRLFRELNLKPTYAIDKSGRMTEAAGKYAGLTIKEARERIIEDLKRDGLVEKIERTVHRTPVCWRSKTPIEFVETSEYYLKQMEFLDEVRKAAERMRFYPPHSKKILLSWIDSVSMDWPISRDRFYSTEIPLWYCKQCGEIYLPPPGRYYQPWKEDPPGKPVCPKCGSSKWVGEVKTFDTWMDSSISPLFVAKYMRDENFFRKSYPCWLRPQGYEIVRTWLYYTILKSVQLLGIPPFQTVRISGLGLDEKGEAMHKSKGNVIYPEPYLEKYGADAFRLWAASESKLGSNYRFSEERIRNASLFLTKLWNISRFISCFPVYSLDDVNSLNPLDKLILGKLNVVIQVCKDSYEKMDVFPVADQIRRFTWSIFADHYIEAVKARAYNRTGTFSESEQKAAWVTLHATLSAILRLLAPITPFITDKIYREMYGKSVHHELLPEPIDGIEDNPELLSLWLDFDSGVWKLKKEYDLSLKDPPPMKLYVDPRLKPLMNDLKVMHNIKEYSFDIPSYVIKISESLWISPE